MDILQNRRKDLDKQACKTFVCPNLSLIDEKGKELHLKDETIKRAKDLAIEYFNIVRSPPPLCATSRISSQLASLADS